MANVYTVLLFREYSQDLCMDLRGSTCPTLFGKLFREDDTTGLPAADLLAANTMLVLKSDQRTTVEAPPAGTSSRRARTQ